MKRASFLSSSALAGLALSAFVAAVGCGSNEPSGADQPSGTDQPSDATPPDGDTSSSGAAAAELEDFVLQAATGGAEWTVQFGYGGDETAELAVADDGALQVLSWSNYQNPAVVPHRLHFASDGALRSQTKLPLTHPVRSLGAIDAAGHSALRAYEEDAPSGEERLSAFAADGSSTWTHSLPPSLVADDNSWQEIRALRVSADRRVTLLLSYGFASVTQCAVARLSATGQVEWATRLPLSRPTADDAFAYCSDLAIDDRGHALIGTSHPEASGWYLTELDSAGAVTWGLPLDVGDGGRLRVSSTRDGWAWVDQQRDDLGTQTLVGRLERNGQAHGPWAARSLSADHQPQFEGVVIGSAPNGAILVGELVAAPDVDGTLWRVRVRGLDRDGTELWRKELGNDDHVLPTGVAGDAAGNVYLSGQTYGAFPGQRRTHDYEAKDAFVHKFIP